MPPEHTFDYDVGMAPFRFAAIALSCALVGACGSDGSSSSEPDTNAGGKADDADGSERVWETIMTAPFLSLIHI